MTEQTATASQAGTAPKPPGLRDDTVLIGSAHDDDAHIATSDEQATATPGAPPADGRPSILLALEAVEMTARKLTRIDYAVSRLTDDSLRQSLGTMEEQHRLKERLDELAGRLAEVERVQRRVIKELMQLGARHTVLDERVQIVEQNNDALPAAPVTPVTLVHSVPTFWSRASAFLSVKRRGRSRV